MLAILLKHLNETIACAHRDRRMDLIPVTATKPGASRYRGVLGRSCANL